MVKRQDNQVEWNKIEKMRPALENGDFKANCGTMPVEIAQAAIQTIAATAPKIFSLTRRCSKGRNVACVRSKEIATRLSNDAPGETLAKTQIRRINSSLSGGLMVQSSNSYAQSGKQMKMLAPVNISAKAWLITMYMLRLRRLRSFR